MTVQLRANAEDLIRFAARPVAPASVPSTLGGIAPDAQVQTASGPVAAEDLHPGDQIMTRERGLVHLLGISQVDTPACTIRTDSLGLARPLRDITVALDQHVALRDWRASALFDASEALVPAGRLMDGVQIADVGTMRLIRLDLGAPLTVVADGLETPTGQTDAGVIDMADID
ncbi:Hint domain-containing protein [Jannaschia sp. 2305UL9-9]|uniref:Hint domain-containing protein n=1 Tax=Jannaschia sp. 2305UL9-9 TaxID=3121638 RepID=UPI0035271275